MAQSGVISRGEALSSAFPGSDFQLQRLYLTDAQIKQIESLIDDDLPSKLYVRFIATSNGKEVGRVYADTHIVRSKRETLLISLRQNSTLVRIDVTAFTEPMEYLPPERWLKQYHGKRKDDEDIDLGRAVRPLLGATLTANAVNEAVKRIQAMDLVLSEKSSGETF